jgi:hypothetical protein
VDHVNETEAAKAQASTGFRLLLMALAAAFLFHGGLLPFTHGNTYDAFIHMFFGDSYHRSWFDTWEPRWYTGFSTTSYPPGTHMSIAALMHVLPLRAAFVVVQLAGLLLLVVGVYRFSLLWVQPRAAGYASLAAVLASSISETIHLFGQLPTIFSLGIFLNGLPFGYRWIVYGKFSNFVAAVVFAAATTAAHHVTTIFGSVLFVVPLAFQALRSVAEVAPIQAKKFGSFRRFVRPFGRGIVLAIFMIIATLVTVLPYWIWSINDPITQVSIPHGSRESFLERTDLGLVFFVLPWGISILFLPFVIYKSLRTRLWPLGTMVVICFVLGTGGTTPIPRAILGGAFDILTLDRFTFWATILILPFIGNMTDGLLHGRSGESIKRAFGRGFHRLIVGGLFASMTTLAVFIAILPTIQPTQPRFIDPAPIAKFLSEDEHDRWRYLTLGFGDQFAYLSAQTTAQSVDGNYHSARRLPDLTRFSVERLENAKYLGVPGLGSLQQFLENADRYHLKFVFSNDAFYDPILHFSGWTRLNRLSNGVTVWERPDVSPLPIIQPRRSLPAVQAQMWGTIPPLALGLAGVIFLMSAVGRGFGNHRMEPRPLVEAQTQFANPQRVRIVVVGLAIMALASATWFAYALQKELSKTASPEDIITTYYDHLDFRRFEEAYRMLDPVTRPPFEEVMFGWRWRGGLIASYGKLTETRVDAISRSEAIIDWRVALDWLTALNVQTQVVDVRTVARDGRWYVAPTNLAATQTPVRLQRDTSVVWNVVGRRQPRPETDLHRDRLDRPRINLGDARLVEYEGRYSVIGNVTNADNDPAYVSLFARMDGVETEQGVGVVNGQRMLPAETAGFRIDFDDVLSLQDTGKAVQFDPTLWIPPTLDAAPTKATMTARALVTGDDLYRGVALNGISVELEDGKPVLSATAVNTGVESATIVRVVASLYDLSGRPIWTQAGFVETNMYPGQSAPFSMTFPRRDAITVLAEIPKDTIVVNGSNQEADTVLPSSEIGTILLVGIDGYTSLRLHLTTMTHDPLE